MGDLMRKRFAMLAEQTTYAGIPVFLDNATYLNKNGYAKPGEADERFFLAGPFDLGSEAVKTYTVSRYAVYNKDGTSTCLRPFNDLTATSVDFWSISSSTKERTITAAGRYVIMPIPKAVAADMYLYMTENGVKTYIFKGCNVTD